MVYKLLINLISISLYLKLHKLAFFRGFLENINLINIPSKWYSDIGHVNKINIISFYKLGPYKDNFTRVIEKQIIFTEGKYYSYINISHTFCYLFSFKIL